MKDKIPKALREQVWLTHVGKEYETKCTVRWCHNIITVFDFQSGHNVPESKGGVTNISNLRPICSRCNSSMNDTYTIDEWDMLSKPPSKWKLWISKYNCLKWKSSNTKENGIKSFPNPMSQSVKHTKFHGVLLSNRILPKKKRTVRGTRGKEKS